MLGGTLNIGLEVIARTGRFLRIFEFVEDEDLIYVEPNGNMALDLVYEGRYAIIQPQEDGPLNLSLQSDTQLDQITPWRLEKPIEYKEGSLTPGYHTHTFEIETPGRYTLISHDQFQDRLIISPLIGEKNGFRLALLTFLVPISLIWLAVWFVRRGYRPTDTKVANERAERLRQLLDKEKST